ncbi:MAG: bifunctional DNA-binding transcriptional regulator/O6-methylguanine-DNA methyltransferase Ada [Chloroflexaceae bacterium]|jgi:AraC family transcriptional regulator of adaptative response/methylated-DNA-[protein]-cysteine methyltransferase|nr:bifunctional DNA-binding transcriptional regulator/O6-methylguanine-DNA methyltransferase Ada [Chloroflexaceae bacterium]
MMTMPIETLDHAAPLDAERCWQAVLNHDAASDGEFVYGVRSTGVYCRPSCSSRRPRRENVAFFAAPDLAEAAGFRPCKRCQPRQPTAETAQAHMVQQVCAYIETHLDETLTLAQLGEAVGVSPHHLQRSFTQALGISPRQYAETRRMEQFKQHVKEGQNVTDALYDAGYGSSSRLYERADAHLGMTPATYRRGGAGASIGYTIADSPLGPLLVAATERGICFVALDDDSERLVGLLRAEFPAASLEAADERLHPWVAAIVNHLHGQQPSLALPLDVQATAFQRRVWEALRAIPYGETRSYSGLAAELGDAKATRAVARACATNPVALVVPCHRVTAADGSMRGYRWGVARKQRLLELEKGKA